MTLNRRTFLTGALAALAAPAIIRTPGLLMPVRRLPVTTKSGAELLAEFLKSSVMEKWVEEYTNAVINQTCFGVGTLVWQFDDLLGVSDLPHWRDMKALSGRSA